MINLTQNYSEIWVKMDFDPNFGVIAGSVGLIPLYVLLKERNWVGIGLTGLSITAICSRLYKLDNFETQSLITLSGSLITLSNYVSQSVLFRSSTNLPY